MVSQYMYSVNITEYKVTKNTVNRYNYNYKTNGK